MKIIRLFKQDILYGTIKQLPIFVFLVCIILISSNGTLEYFMSLNTYGISTRIGTFGDYIMYAFQGLWIYEFSINSTFAIPIYWLAINLFIAVTVGGYPYDDFNGYGRIKIMRGGSRVNWMVSKVLWVVFHVLFCYMVMYITIFFFCLFHRVDMSFNLSNDIWANTIYQITKCPKMEIWIIGAILPIFASITISITQTAISLILQAQLGYVFVTILLIISVYWTTPLLIANYTMWSRNVIIDERGVDTFSGIILNILICASFVSVLINYIKKCDIINKSTRI